MRKVMVFIRAGLIMILLSCSVVSSYAQFAGSLEDTVFAAFILCDDDVEGYCDKGQLEREEFLFGEDGSFAIGTFEDQLVLSGSYNERGMFFDAELSVLEDVIKNYDFTITGLLIFNNIMVGRCDIEYTFMGLGEEDARCYFLGFSNDGGLLPTVE